MKKPALTFGFALLLASQSAFAWDKTTTGKVANIQVLSNGDINFWLVGNPNLCLAAPNLSVGQVRVGYQSVTTEGQRALFNALSAAMLAGKNVNVYANNSGPWGCQVGAIDFTN